MEKLNFTLGAVRNLRSSVRQCFEKLADGSPEQNEENNAKFLLEFQENFSDINHQIKELEGIINSLQVPPAPYYLGNTTYLAQETTQDRQALYSQLVNSYKWIDKVHDHSLLAYNNLNVNSLRRSYIYNSQKRGRVQCSTCNTPDPDHTDNLFSEISHPNTTYKVCRPFGSSAVVVITISHVLKAALVCKGVLIEWVSVKGFDEHIDFDDLFAESRYAVFRKVQENTQAAMLHFFSPTLPDLAIKSYMAWFHSYSRLFVEPCKRCGKFLANGLPPTWRDLRTLEPYHEECKN
ncbi:mediator complex subunit 27 isoform 1-T3 [Glossina fuscipes fuscipes]|uniref:Uncharacterized protein n=1 Tax=Glossina palpalis gambiensis TaxID=67801 RepID=A0A1B0AWK8_9MUSC